MDVLGVDGLGKFQSHGSEREISALFKLVRGQCFLH